MIIRMGIASGRAKCKYCRGLIKAGTKCYIVGEYKSEVRLHINLKACERYKMVQRLEYEAANELTKEFNTARTTKSMNELALATARQVKI